MPEFRICSLSHDAKRGIWQVGLIGLRRYGRAELFSTEWLGGRAAGSLGRQALRMSDHGNRIASVVPWPATLRMQVRAPPSGSCGVWQTAPPRYHGAFLSLLHCLVLWARECLLNQTGYGSSLQTDKFKILGPTSDCRFWVFWRKQTNFASLVYQGLRIKKNGIKWPLGQPPRANSPRSGHFVPFFSLDHPWLPKAYETNLLAAGAPTNRSLCVWENFPTKSGWKSTRKDVEVPIFCPEMLMTSWILIFRAISSRHLVYIHFCFWLGLFPIAGGWRTLGIDWLIDTL